MPYGYCVSNGYFGMVNGKYILFATEDEYYEYLKERETYGKG